jgi:NAD(P)H-dependent FMN reductase
MLSNHQPPIRLLAIGGSTRATSRSLQAMRAILATAPDHGLDVEIASVHDLSLPVYNDDIPLDEQPASLRRLIEQVAGADAYLICSPTYHGSMSGAIKNVLDSLHIVQRQPGSSFDGKPVALAAYGGPTAINVVNTLQTVVRSMRGTLVPTVVTVARDAFDPDTGTIADAQTVKRADAMLGEIATFVAMRRAHEAVAVAG